ncbi:hypothetical protein B0T16DRAFT_459182 [Cercophora newfieldiana]|uniref:AA1-like domain-containing protein n=1 Tax=Cercophora newfieldiana TaxID=92897 RepID=A0AA39XZ50_9PEZI|nr:hypothetical protein B0T16DRAFT_459182 [Cercophora newfieldiana]
MMYTWFQLLLFLLPLSSLANHINLESSTNGCIRKSISRDYSWTVTFTYGSYIEYGAPSHIMPSWAYVVFDLENPVTNRSYHCHGQSTMPYNWFLDVLPDPWFNCALGETWFNVDVVWTRSPSRLVVKQDWECHLDDKSARFKLTSFGEVAPPLDCSVTEWENPKWSIPQVYSTYRTQCNTVTLEVKPYKVEILHGE